MFGDAKLETSAAGGMDELSRVEIALGLQPQSYGFFDEYGRVEAPALQRALDTASTSPCKLDVREHPEWKRMRDMDEQIKTLAMHAQAFGPSLQAMEARILQKVDAELSDIRQGMAFVDTKVNSTVSSFLQSMALEHLDLRAQIESLDISELRSAIDCLNAECAAAAIASSCTSQFKMTTDEGINIWVLMGI